MDKNDKNLNLSTKQSEIFKLIVEAYIETGEPIGSKKLLEKNKLECSSATIRNIMSELEDFNLLEKLHTSGGRIPSTFGLEYYAKYLVYDPSKYFNQKLDDLLAKRRIRVDATIDEAASIISKMANFTVVATSNNASETLKSIQLTPINDSSAIVVIVTSSGKVDSKMFNYDKKEIELSDLKIAIRLFKERLIDTPLIELSDKAKALAPLFAKQIKNYELILQKFIKTIFVFEEKTNTKAYNKNAIILSKNINREEIAKVLELIEEQSVWETIENNVDEDNNIKLDLSRPNLSIISKRINFEESFETLDLLEKLIKEKNNEN